MAELKEKTETQQKEELLAAEGLKKQITTMPLMTIKKKVGPNRQLFGAVSSKNLLENLNTLFPSFKSVLESRAFGITAVNEVGDDGSVGAVVAGTLKQWSRRLPYI